MKPLAKYDAACRALAAAASTDEVRGIRDEWKAIKAYARQAQNRDLLAQASAIQLRAERRLGEMIIAQKELGDLKEGRARAHNDKTVRLTLKDVGISRDLSSKAQRLARVPAAHFDGMLAELQDKIVSETARVTKSLLRAGEIIEARGDYTDQIVDGGTVEDLVALAASGYRAGAISADPPWKYETYSGKGRQRSAERYYDTESVEEICAKPVAPLAADDCVLFLWAVWPELAGALKVIDAWGFTYKTCGFSWLKLQRGADPASFDLDDQFDLDDLADADLRMGMGYWTRANTEVCLLATKGKPRRRAKGVRQVILSPLREHSEKPPETRGRIQQLVGGPYLELYGREPVDGWTVWGNQVRWLAPASFSEAAE